MSRPILSLDAVRKSFGRTEIIRGATLDVSDGEIHALIGPNGAGKSTLFHLISGLLTPSSGRITFLGRRIDGHRPAEIARMGLARSFQQTRAFDEMSVGENLAVATMWSRGERGAIHRSVTSMRTVSDRVEEVLDLVGLTAYRHAPVSGLAYSESRSLEVALAVAGDPRLVLLDEPTAGMSRAETAVATDIIRRVARGRTVVLIEHDMNVVFDLADTVSMLVYGSVLISGTPAEVQANEHVRQAYLGHGTAVMEHADG
jgi:branched-chain amino acid transport system ATP-binding protein